MFNNAKQCAPWENPFVDASNCVHSRILPTKTLAGHLCSNFNGFPLFPRHCVAMKSSSLYSSVGGHLNGSTNTHMVNSIEESLYSGSERRFRFLNIAESEKVSLHLDTFFLTLWVRLYCWELIKDQRRDCPHQTTVFSHINSLFDRTWKQYPKSYANVIHIHH